ncbi:MAG: hypothetical protein QOI11_3997 [Candidatus Eremiobacteraeota bacterium]|nr:hypothetical protein [Candidatus Eremiobacteraeota bacterium]
MAVTAAPLAASTLAPQAGPAGPLTTPAAGPVGPAASAGPAGPVSPSGAAAGTGPPGAGTPGPAAPGAGPPGSAAPAAGQPAGRSAASPSGAAPGPQGSPDATALLNAKLKALTLGGGSTMKQYGPDAADLARRAVEAYEAAVAPPAEVLAKTFGLIRVRRTAFVADSVAYVFERRQTPFGERCRAFRVTDHPKPPPPPRFDPNHPERNPIPDRNPDLKPEVEYIDVSCSDRRMEPVVPGSLKTPVPRHL